MKRFTALLLAFVAVAFILFYGRSQYQEEFLVEIWSLGGFKNPESVVFDPDETVLYVSNVNGNPTDKDGNGFISRVSLDGTLEEIEWLSGLNGPKGMDVHDGRLYIADIDELLEVDLSTKSITRHGAPQAGFLNDVAADPKNGDIYVSDMSKDVIYRLSGGTFEPWLNSADLENPNGLLVEGDDLILGAWGAMTDGFATKVPGQMKRISLSDKSVKNFGEDGPIGNLDGVEPDGRGNYFVTDWLAGLLMRVNPLGRAVPLLDLNQGSADLEFVLLFHTGILYIPMMADNSVVAYQLR